MLSMSLVAQQSALAQKLGITALGPLTGGGNLPFKLGSCSLNIIIYYL